MKRKEPIAVTQAIQALTKLGQDYGLEAIHTAYAEAISELMACEVRNEWRARIAQAQGELAMLETR